MIVGVTVLVHDPGSMPKRRTPPAPILMRSVSIKNEPATLHFGVTQLQTPMAGHLALVDRQIHVFCGISI
jgi:hypothetical protein